MGFFKHTPKDDLVQFLSTKEKQLEVIEEKREEFLSVLRIIRKNIKSYAVLDKQAAQDFQHLIDRLMTKSSHDTSITIALKTAEALSERILHKKNLFGKQDIDEFLKRIGWI
ncbi:hypothetical protein JXB28_03355 [Candidatus Woesearchaeota archaeon]|nr:hypothetical protein [Candidatus Woesearchaeota archaeon]